MQYAGPAVRPSVTRSHAARQPRLWHVVGSLLLLSISYLLLTAAPAGSQQLRNIAGGERSAVLGTWALPFASTGLLLGGGAALVLVLVQLASDARRRPYAYLSPVMATFSACILVGLGAKLPLASVSSEPLAVFALVVAVVGGALMQDARPALQRTGLMLTLGPSVSLLLMVWAATGAGDPAVGLWTLGPAALGYLVILTVSSFAIAATSLAVQSQEPGSASARRSGHDVVGTQEFADYAVRVGVGRPTFGQRAFRRLHKPLFAICGIVLAVGVVRAIVGASSGREEALTPALIESVNGPTVTPWVAPGDGEVGKPAAVARSEANSKVSERMLTNATAHAVAHQEPRVRRHRSGRAERAHRAERGERADRAERAERPKRTRRTSRRSRARLARAQPAEVAEAPVKRSLGDDEWNVEITAPKRALTPMSVSKPATQQVARATTARAEPPPAPEPKPAAKAAPAGGDSTLDALMTDVLSTVK